MLSDGKLDVSSGRESIPSTLLEEKLALKSAIASKPPNGSVPPFSLHSLSNMDAGVPGTGDASVLRTIVSNKTPSVCYRSAGLLAG